MDTHPENTLPSLQEAIVLGAQMIEFDLQLTRDSVLVLMHDKSVDRTTNGKGNVADLTFAEIRNLDAGAWKHPSFAGIRVPTFSEVLAIMPRNVWLNCHLKGGADVGAAAARMLQQSGRMHQAFLTCSEAAALGARKVVPEIMICNGENRYRTNGPEYTAATIAMKARFIQFLPPQKDEDRPTLIRLLQQNGVHVNYYQALTPAEVGPLFNSGIDFILVNNLSQFQEAARLKGVLPVRPQF
jgi:glycerophosphoryl diester phosphodiesterase